MSLELQFFVWTSSNARALQHETLLPVRVSTYFNLFCPTVFLISLGELLFCPSPFNYTPLIESQYMYNVQSPLIMKQAVYLPTT